MKILLTGSTGYIGKRLLRELVKQGHQVVCCVRDRRRFNPDKELEKCIEVIEVDLLNKGSLSKIPPDCQAAYYLVHSMASSHNYLELEKKSAIHFREAVAQTKIQQVIYLGGIVHTEGLSEHLTSRKTVEDELKKGVYQFTSLRAGIIIGSGSASFEIIRDLVEKLPIMITPIWLKTKCQPISVRDVVGFLTKSLLNSRVYGRDFDIGGPDTLSYQEMLLGYAKARGLKRKIFVVPVMTPKLSSYWLYFITSTPFKLAAALVDSMKVNVVCRNQELNQILGINPISYATALEKTLSAIEGHRTISSWKDSLSSSHQGFKIAKYITVPTHGCFIDKKMAPVVHEESCLNKIWAIGGQNGWYYATFLWQLRGLLDRLVGGVGLRRGRTHATEISAGDTLDFWRVLVADKKHKRLLLFAEMKLPGEAWLEFSLKENQLYQTATFRPKGVLGRLYWYSVYPFHGSLFSGMIKALVKDQKIKRDG